MTFEKTLKTIPQNTPKHNILHWRIQGGRQGRAPPRGPNSFIFMQFSAKKWKIIAILGVGAPPGENPGSATVLYSKINA